MNNPAIHSSPAAHLQGEVDPLRHPVPQLGRSRHELVNDAISGGAHRLWEQAAIDWLAPRGPQRLLELSFGVGNLALRALRQAPLATAVICGTAAPALASGRANAARCGLAERSQWVRADATMLPFAAQSFDACLVNFALHDVNQIPRLLAEAYRVLRFGGRVLVLEFSHPPAPGARWLYDRYSFWIIPAVAEFLAGERVLYQTLVQTIRGLPDQESLAEMLRAAGFDRVSYRNLSMGIAVLQSGWKL